MTSTNLPTGIRPRRLGGSLIVELTRLGVVVLVTVAALELSEALVPLGGLRESDGGWLMGFAVLGVACGYVAGGVTGRFTLGRIDAAERRLRVVSAGELLSGVIGGCSGLLVAAALAWPLLLVGPRLLAVSLAALVALILGAAGLRIGLARGGDLLRFLGVSGRLPVAAPARGAAVKVVDTSALVDGRLVEVCRSGFCEGTLVVPHVVLHELQSLADAGDPQRRSRGRRGLDALGALQRSAGVTVEVADRDFPEIRAVDAKLVALARERGAALLTVDGNLGRVAEIQGVRVLNLHALADTLRPPVLPGDELAVRIVRAGTEPGQGVGYLDDGTMVVVAGGHDRQGAEIAADVTSILSTPNGRMVFATRQGAAVGA